MVKKNHSDITVVVQGPVQSLDGRGQDAGITHQCLNSIRQHLPGAKIILSTWDKQDLSGLDYDELYINDDPGTNVREYKRDGKPVEMNNNRQIASSLGGLKRVKTKYALKLRSDNYLTGNQFVALQQQYVMRSGSCFFLTERVVVINTFTRQYHSGKRVAFHASDFFHFGLTEDVLRIWDIPLLKNLEYSEANKGKAQNRGFPQINIDCTQSFWLASINKYDPSVGLAYLYDCSTEILELSDRYYANNLIVAAPEDIGLGLGDKFVNPKRSKSGRKSGLVCFMSFKEWQVLYKKYCDKDYTVSGLAVERLRLFFWRCLLVFPRRLETEAKLRRRKVKGY